MRYLKKVSEDSEGMLFEEQAATVKDDDNTLFVDARDFNKSLEGFQDLYGHLTGLGAKELEIIYNQIRNEDEGGIDSCSFKCPGYDKELGRGNHELCTVCLHYEGTEQDLEELNSYYI